MTDLDPVDVRALSEGQDLEVKKAAGRDGRGELPSRSFFETYSAMANTTGGVVWLGIAEPRPGEFEVHGIEDVDRVLTALWSGLNDRHQVSVNLLTSERVQVVELGGRRVIRVDVPRALRTQRPVHVGTNPFGGTYRRGHEGDFRCDEETVRRMLAERVEESRDAAVLEHYTLDDLDRGSVETYRNQLRATLPGHPWLDLPEQELLRSLGAWGRDRERGVEGLTRAGLLMFGRLRPILEVFPNYVVDYQERPAPAAEARWVDRVTTDGTWSGNLFDFHRLVMRRLTADLKVPFRLEGTVRRDETVVHEALREALTNALIHADYSGRVSVLVVKRPDLFGFRNPGTMRIPLEDAQRGGHSDCRNRNLQKMFQLIGLGEQAGSGLPKIYRAWRQESWRAPELSERYDLEQTLLEMRMVSLLPTEVVDVLRGAFGRGFDELSEPERLAVVTAAVEGQVTNSRLRSITSEHPRDLTSILGGLVRKGMLESEGATRATAYRLAGRAVEAVQPSLFGGGLECSELDPSRSEQIGSRSEHTGPSSERSDRGAPPDADQGAALDSLAVSVRSRRRAPRGEVQETIEALCDGRFLSVAEIAGLIGRNPETVRVHYVIPMTKAGRLEMRYPAQLNHPRQAYRKAAQP